MVVYLERPRQLLTSGNVGRRLQPAILRLRFLIRASARRTERKLPVPDSRARYVHGNLF